MKTGDRDVIVLAVTAELAGHLTIAVQEHRKWARRAGLAVPDELDEIERALAIRARRGQTGTPVEDLWTLRHAQTVTPRLLDYAAAGQVLGVSVRTVKRLVAAGHLPVVRVLGAARIRVEQLDAYLEQLDAQPLSPKGTSC